MERGVKYPYFELSKDDLFMNLQNFCTYFLRDLENIDFSVK